jgi:hypothetical protein
VQPATVDAINTGPDCRNFLPEIAKAFREQKSTASPYKRYLKDGDPFCTRLAGIKNFLISVFLVDGY